MEYYPDKCAILRIKWKCTPLETNYTLDGHQLEVVDYLTKLGVEISNDLSLNRHINEVKAKANRTL